VTPNWQYWHTKDDWEIEFLGKRCEEKKIRIDEVTWRSWENKWRHFGESPEHRLLELRAHYKTTEMFAPFSFRRYQAEDRLEFQIPHTFNEKFILFFQEKRQNFKFYFGAEVPI